MISIPVLIAIGGLSVPACALTWAPSTRIQSSALTRNQSSATVTVTANTTFTEYACVSNNLPPVTVTECLSTNSAKIVPYSNTTLETISTAPTNISPFIVTTTETVTSAPTDIPVCNITTTETVTSATTVVPACNVTTTETVTAVVLTSYTSSSSQPTALETSGQSSTKPGAATSKPTPTSASSAIPTQSARGPTTPLDIAHCKASWEDFKAKVDERKDKYGSKQPHLNNLNDWEEVGARAESSRITNEVCTEQQYHALSGALQNPIEYAS